MKRFAIAMALAAGIATGLASAIPAGSAQTLRAVKERGSLLCGVSQGLYGFSAADDKGNWTGFDVDLCRAIAAAIFDDPGKVKFVPLSAGERFAALKSGAIDVLSRNTTWTMSRETPLGLHFAGFTYYDGQGFLVSASLKVESALELDGKTVCTQTGTTTELNLTDYFANNKMKHVVMAFATADETLKAYESGRCSVLTSDMSQLYAERLKLAKPGDHIILPDIISKEPLGPAVRQGDDQWFNIVKWTHFAMVNAEELGVSQATIEQAMRSEKPDVKRLVGTEGNYGEELGLTRDWAARIVRHVGNYDEVFERNVGTSSKLGIPRGVNNLWTNGGIQYAPPIR
jgi:general L-amino acid transport system substrate-binding protein